MDLPEKAKRAPPAPVWNQSFPSPKALFVRGTFFIWCYPLVHSRGRSPIRNLGTRVAAVVPQLASGTATATNALPFPAPPCGKSEAEVTDYRRLCSTCCTIEANYWQTRSIVQRLCNSRASCLVFDTVSETQETKSPMQEC